VVGGDRLASLGGVEIVSDQLGPVVGGAALAGLFVGPVGFA